MIRALLATAALLCAPVAWSHPEMAPALTRLNAALVATPTSAELYLERGELYAKYRDPIAAEANFLRAAELAPDLPRLARARGALALDNGQPREALAQLNRALTLVPRDADALILRARAHAAVGDTTAALADYDAALAILENPRPELFLARVELLSSPHAAIRALDDAIARIGPAHTLQLRALQLEESAGLVDAALARLDAIAAQSERRETWLKRRGDLLLRAGRRAEARDAYRAALVFIAALPEWLRQSPDTARLTLELQSSS